MVGTHGRATFVTVTYGCSRTARKGYEYRLVSGAGVHGKAVRAADMTQEYTAESVTADEEQHRTGSRVRKLIDRWRHDPGIWRRGIVLAILAVLVSLLMIFHAQLPNTIGNLGSLTETFLPWFGSVRSADSRPGRWCGAPPSP